MMTLAIGILPMTGACMVSARKDWPTNFDSSGRNDGRTELCWRESSTSVVVGRRQLKR